MRVGWGWGGVGWGWGGGGVRVGVGWGWGWGGGGGNHFMYSSFIFFLLLYKLPAEKDVANSNTPRDRYGWGL